MTRAWCCLALWALLLGVPAAQEFDPDYIKATRALVAKDYVQARTLAEELLSRSPDSITGHAVLGQVHLWAEADLAQADFHLSRALAKIESDYTFPLKKEEVRRLHKSVLVALRKVKFDRGAYRESLGLLDLHDRYYEPRLVHLRGWPWLKLGDFEAARRELDQARAEVDPSDPRYPEILDTYGQLSYESGDPARAQELFEEAWLVSEEVSQQPDPAYLTNAGESARDLGRFETAEEHWLGAADWPHPYTQAAPLQQLAQLYAGRGDFEAAFQALDGARKWRSQLDSSVAHLTRASHLTEVALVLVAGGDGQLAAEAVERALMERFGQAKNSSRRELLESRLYLVYAAALQLEAERLSEEGEFWRSRQCRLRRWWAQTRAGLLAAGVEGGLALQLRPYGPGSLNAPWLRGECLEAWGRSVAGGAGWEQVSWVTPLGQAREWARQGRVAEAMAVDRAVVRRLGLSLGLEVRGDGEVARRLYASPRFHPGVDWVVEVEQDLSARLTGTEGREWCRLGPQADVDSLCRRLHREMFRAPLKRTEQERVAVTEAASPSRVYSKQLQRLLK